MLYAILAALGFAAYVIYNKEVFVRFNFSVRNYVPLLFIFLFVISLALFPWLGEIKPEALNLKYLGLLGLTVILAIGWNKLFYAGLKKENLAEFELITMLYPLVTIFLAAVFIPKEWNIHIFIAGVIGGLALVFSHIKYHHLRFKKMETTLLWCVLLMGAEAIVQRYLLDVLSPIAFYTIRTGIMMLVYPFILKPHWKEFNKTQIGAAFVLAAIAVFFMVMQFYSFIKLGVGFTVLAILIQPILVFSYALIIRGEKFQARKIIAAVIIIMAIIYAYSTIGF